MKRIFVSGILLLFTIMSCFSQIHNFDELCKKYKHYEDVETIKVNRFGCLLLSMFAGEKSGIAEKFMKKSSSFHLLTCEGSTSKEIQKDVKEFISNSKLEELMTVTEKDSEVKIYVQDKDNVIRQLFLAVVDKNDMVFIRVEGKFPLDLIRDITKEK